MLTCAVLFELKLELDRRGDDDEDKEEKARVRPSGGSSALVAVAGSQKL